MSNLTIQVGAEVTGLQTNLAIASAESKKFAADVRDLARQIVATSDDAIKAKLVGELRNASAEAGKAAAAVRALKADLADLGSSKGAGALAGSTNELQAQIDAITGVSGAYRNAEESASVFARALGVPDTATANLREMNAALEGTRVNSGAAREGIVLLHEAIQGRFSRIPGSLIVLSEAFGGIGFKAVASIAGVGALAYAIVEFAEKAVEANNAVSTLESTMARLGQLPEGGLQAVKAQVAELGQRYGMGTQAAAEFANSVRASSTVTTEAVTADIYKIAASVAEQKGKFSEIGNIGEELAKQSQTTSGLKAISDEYKLGLDGMIDAVGKDAPTLLAKQKKLFDALEQQFADHEAATAKYEQSNTLLGFLATIGGGDSGPTDPETYQAQKEIYAPKPSPELIKAPPLTEGQQDQTVVLKEGIAVAEQAIAQLTADQTKSASERAAAEARVWKSVVVPPGTENTADAEKITKAIADLNRDAAKSSAAEFIAAEQAKNQAAASTGRETRAQTIAAELATDQAILAQAGISAEERTRYEQQVSIKTAELSRASAEEKIKALERVAEADKRGSAKSISDLRAAQGAAEAAFGAQSDQALQLGEQIAASQRENAEQAARASAEASKKAEEEAKREAEAKKRALEEYFKEYTLGIQEQIAAAKGNYAEQETLAQAYVDTSSRIFTENSNEFREAEKLKTSVAKEENAERLKVAQEGLQAQIASIKGQQKEQLDALSSRPPKGILADPQQLATEKEGIIAAAALAEDAVERQREAAAATDKALQASIFRERVDLATAAEAEVIKIQRNAAQESQAEWDKVNKQIGSSLADAIDDALLGKKGGAAAAFGKFLNEQLKSALSSGLSNAAGLLEKSIGLGGKSPGNLVNSGLDSLGLGGVGEFFGIGADKGKDAAVEQNIAALKANTQAIQAQAAKGTGPGPVGAPAGGGQANFSAGFEGGFASVAAGQQQNTAALQQTGANLATLGNVVGNNTAAGQILGDVTKIQTVATLPNTVATIGNTVALEAAAIGSLLGFAGGGRPPTGRPSMVGERGPELFIPDGAGTIIPNGQLPSFATGSFGVGAGGGSVTNIGGSSRGGDSRSLNLNQRNTVNISNGAADLRSQIKDMVKSMGLGGARAELARMLG
jgi:hypothetical protein